MYREPKVRHNATFGGKKKSKGHQQKFSPPS